MRLRDIAHARAGDKGDTSNISVIAYNIRDFRRLANYVTVGRVRLQLGSIARGPIARFELPQLGALNFVLENSLGGGVTRSLALDTHGKSLSSALLELQLPEDWDKAGG
jgi:hypothetical protein